MKTTLLAILASTLLSHAQEPTLPVEREITDTTGRKIAGTITGKSETGIKFLRKSDSKEFDIPLDKLSVPDRIYLQIDPPDALYTQRFPFRIHAPLRRHGKPNGGTTTIEPGEPVEMIAQDGKTITIHHAGQELQFQIPASGGETTATPPAKSRWNPAIRDMGTKEFLAATTYDKDGPDPAINKILEDAAETAYYEIYTTITRWYSDRNIKYPTELPIIATFMSLTLQRPGAANALIKEAESTRSRTIPAAIMKDPVAAVGYRYLDCKLRAKKKPPVDIVTFHKGIEDMKANIGWKSDAPLSLPELAKAFLKILPDPGSGFSDACYTALDTRRLAPLFPFAQHNEIIVEKIKSSIRKGKNPVLISTVRWEGKAANGKDIGKTHTTFCLGYESDGTTEGTSLQCMDADGQIRNYPAEDVFSVWNIGFIFKEDLMSGSNSNDNPNDLSQHTPNEKIVTVKIEVNETALLRNKSGATALLQFTNVQPRVDTPGNRFASASYRWKYLPGTGQPTQSGKGEVRESYTTERYPDVPNTLFITPKPDHDETVNAGQLSIRWSPGVLYYYPSRGQVEILPSDASAEFDKP